MQEEGAVHHYQCRRRHELGSVRFVPESNGQEARKRNTLMRSKLLYQWHVLLAKVRAPSEFPLPTEEEQLMHEAKITINIGDAATELKPTYMGLAT